MLLEKIYAVYAESGDMTFIMKDTYDRHGEAITTEVVGWHYGDPDRKITPEYIGKLAATD